MKIYDMQIEDLHPYEKNPRKNDEAVPAVANSIKTFGFKVPIVIDKDHVIVAGHTRYKAAKRLGLKTVPCIIADDLTADQVKAFRLADNKVGELAEWDFALLKDELGDIVNIDMEDFGFGVLAEDEEEINVEEDGYDAAPPEEPKSKRGQIYRLGEHILLCGDSTDPADVEKLMQGTLADMAVTDPPYNVDIGITDIEDAKRRKRRLDGKTIDNDKMTDEDFMQFLGKCFENMAAALKPGGAYYVWYAIWKHIIVETTLRDAGLAPRQQLIWNKNTIIMGRQDYQWKHEPCLYGWKEGAAHFFIDDRTLATVIEDAKTIDPKKLKKEELVELVQSMLSDKMSTTVINEAKPAASPLHPTMKPIRLIARQIRNSSRVGETVLDLFGGSGTTLMACQQLNRRCRMMEYDPRYVDAIIDRWQSFTGKTAELIGE